MSCNKKTVGILGGMGPAATVELFSRIVNNTSAHRDSEHVNLVIINDPSIPDRTNFILENGDSPIPKMEENLKKLYLAGADTVVIPCMTAHAFINELQRKSPIPIINAIKLIEHYLQLNSDIKKIGLLATTGSINSGSYQKFISRELLLPSEQEQEMVMSVIYKVKGGKFGLNEVKEMGKVVKSLKGAGAQAIIAGCTELGIILNDDNMQIKVLDPLSFLAAEAIRIGT